jgi:serine/threonine protein phosphatase PrpC
MIDRWFYQRADKTFGPVTAAMLRQMAANGQLLPTDYIWPEGVDPSRAVAAQSALDFSTAPPPRTASMPDWMDDLRQIEQKAPPPLAAAKPPDWLADIRQANASEELLNIPFDAELVEVEEEAAAELLRDEEEEEEAAPPTPEPAPAAAPPSSKATPSPPAVAPPRPGSLSVPPPKPVSPAASAATAPQAAPRGPVTPPPPSPGRLAIGSATTRGRVRDRNEDSLLVQQFTWANLDQWHDLALIVVADGMGGYQAGEQASGLVIRTISCALNPLLLEALSRQGQAPTPDELAEALENSLSEANSVVHDTAQDKAAWKGMGATAVAVLVWNGLAIISLVGDCRVYHWRNGRLTQVTRDQTLVARMVELGQLTEEEAATHPRRTEVAQAIGRYTLVQPARYQVSITPGDWLVASCDGLQAHVDDRQLQNAIVQCGESPTRLANQLIDLANQGGGSDNCTVVALRCC